MDRIEKIRLLVDAHIARIYDPQEKQCALVHLYGVAQFCALLAKKRRMDAELPVIAGMLHDLYAYTVTPEEHAIGGSLLAKKLLEPLGLFSTAELDQLCQAIRNHSDKARCHDALSELLKDADVLQHVLYDPTLPVRPAERMRYASLCRELGLPVPPSV